MKVDPLALIRIVNNAKAGLSAFQIAREIGHPSVHTVSERLCALYKAGQVERRRVNLKHQRYYAYFPAKPRDWYNEQLREDDA